MTSSSSSIWSVHLDALSQCYPGRIQMLTAAAGAEPDIVHHVRVLDSSGWDVIVKLPKGFPEDAPVINFAGYAVPFRWTVEMLLPEAVQQAVSSLGKLAGNVGVIKLSELSHSISQNPRVDAARSAEAMRALVDASPVVQKCQAELDLLWAEIDRTAKSNLAMQPQIAQLQADVSALQHQVRSGLAGLGGRRRDVLEVLPLGSNEGLLRVAREELRELEEAATAACKMLGAASGGGGSSSSNAAGTAAASARSRALSGSATGQNLYQQQQQPPSVHMSLATPFMSAIDENGEPQQQQSDGNADEMNGGGGHSATTTTTTSAGNDADVFFVSTAASAPAAGPKSPSTHQGNSGPSPGSVFSAPFSLDSSRGGGGARAAADIGDDDEDEDDGTDEMERRLEYAVKSCAEARRAALLIRRFAGTQASNASSSSSTSGAGTRGGV